MMAMTEGRAGRMDEERAQRSYFLGREAAMDGEEPLTRERIEREEDLDLDPDAYERGYRSFPASTEGSPHPGEEREG